MNEDVKLNYFILQISFHETRILRVVRNNLTKGLYISHFHLSEYGSPSILVTDY